MSRLDELRAEYHELIHSIEFAYAMGQSRTIERDPRLQPCLAREAELGREITRLSAEQPDDEPRS